MTKLVDPNFWLEMWIMRNRLQCQKRLPLGCHEVTPTSTPPLFTMSGKDTQQCIHAPPLMVPIVYCGLPSLDDAAHFFNYYFWHIPKVAVLGIPNILGTLREQGFDFLSVGPFLQNLPFGLKMAVLSLCLETFQFTTDLGGLGCYFGSPA